MNGLIFIEFQWIKQLIVPRCGDSFNYKSEANLHPFVRIFSRMERFEILQGFLNLVPITRRSGLYKLSCISSIHAAADGSRQKQASALRYIVIFWNASRSPRYPAGICP